MLALLLFLLGFVWTSGAGRIVDSRILLCVVVAACVVAVIRAT